jgi:hypothetical protein
MAFVVQGDEPVDNANSYVSVAYFRSYHADRGQDVTGYSDTLVEYALVKAAQYLDVRFEYVGERKLSTQDLEWPRNFAYDDRNNFVTGLPLAVKKATCEYALRALTTVLLPDPSQTPDGVVKSKTEQVGPLVEKTEFAWQVGDEMPSYPLADQILISRGLVVGEQRNRGTLMSGLIGRA